MFESPSKPQPYRDKVRFRLSLFFPQRTNILLEHVQAWHNDQDNGGGKDDPESQRYGHGDQMRGLAGSFKDNGCQAAKSGQRDGAKTPDTGFADGFKGILAHFSDL